jgi:dTDP-glucose 4,6-dehydratase
MSQARKVLITGGAGFIGHHIAEHILANTDWDIIILDKLTYASNGYERLRDSGVIENKRLRLYTADIVQPMSFGLGREIGDVDYVLHMAAETHVDNSIVDPEPFVMANVVGTMRMLDWARRLDRLQGFAYFSTDEVFGPADKGVSYDDWARYDSTNPYSASKAGGEELCLAYANTYKMPIFITHCMNAFGERQHPEKFIPLVINKVLKDEVVSIHSDAGCKTSGSRNYIHCRNIASAVLFLLDHFAIRDKYNISGECEIENLVLAQRIAEIMGKELRYEMVDFHSSRPGHDLRYALDGSKLWDMGWKLPKTFNESLEKTVRWYLDHPKWITWQ